MAYKSVIDFERFQRFVQEAELPHTDKAEKAGLADRVAARLARERMAELLPAKGDVTLLLNHAGSTLQKSLNICLKPLGKKNCKFRQK